MNLKFFQRLLTVCSLFGGLGVAAGAFGAHTLKSKLPNESLETIKTAVLYLFIHTLATLFICYLGRQQPESRLLKGAGLAFVVGICLFSGSLFIIATNSLTGFPVSYIGPVTPIGGLCFLTGLFLLFLFSLRSSA